MGGLFAVLAYARGSGGYAALAVQRFSRVALWCIVIVGASGVINALIRVHLDELFTTTYGRGSCSRCSRWWSSADSARSIDDGPSPP